MANKSTSLWVCYAQAILCAVSGFATVNYILTKLNVNCLERLSSLIALGLCLFLSWCPCPSFRLWCPSDFCLAPHFGLSISLNSVKRGTTLCFAAKLIQCLGYSTCSITVKWMSKWPQRTSFWTLPQYLAGNPSSALLSNKGCVCGKVWDSLTSPSSPSSLPSSLISGHTLLRGFPAYPQHLAGSSGSSSVLGSRPMLYLGCKPWDFL